jgi:hypothetical protein
VNSCAGIFYLMNVTHICFEIGNVILVIHAVIAESLALSSVIHSDFSGYTGNFLVNYTY